MELILMFQDDKHHDELHHFVDDEPLDSLDRDELIKKITKSFGIELIKIEKVVKKKLNINDLVKLAHCAIDIVIYKCNSALKRKNAEASTDGSNKKIKTSEPSVSSFVS
jgi:acyl carrier protein